MIRRVATYISESWYTDEVTQPYRRLEKEFIETPNALDGDSIVSGDGSYFWPDKLVFSMTTLKEREIIEELSKPERRHSLIFWN